MKTYRGVNVQIHVFSTSTLAGRGCAASRPGRFILGTHWIGGWMGPSVGQDDVEKRKFLTLPGLTPTPQSSSP
jgi:hypothetical protein